MIPRERVAGTHVAEQRDPENGKMSGMIYSKDPAEEDSPVVNYSDFFGFLILTLTSPSTAFSNGIGILIFGWRGFLDAFFFFGLLINHL